MRTDSTCHEFSCSGFLRANSAKRKTDQKRATRAKPSVKIGFCPARVVLKLGADGSAAVEHHFTHSHPVIAENDLRHVRLPQSTRDMVAAQLSVGVPVTRILSDATAALAER